LKAVGLEVLDVECLRRHYEKTLKLWSQNYENQESNIRALVDETTFRAWRIYLAGCAHAFSENWLSLYQVLACKSGAEEKRNPTQPLCTGE
jgi:cyclopropane-fatty-acyl-phospholipid synthase